MKVSISRSVGRAFEVMEVFKKTRRPATATEIRQEMGCPHSSVVAVLHNLVDLGYLSYNDSTHLYFPTGKLSALGTWVQPALKGSGRLRIIADAIALETGHSTAITCRSNLFLNILYARRGLHPQAEQIPTCIGVSLVRSIPGIAILAQMSDEDIRDAVAKIAVWSAKARAEQASDLADVMRAVRQTRERGAAIAFDWSFAGTGAIAVKLESPFDSGLMAVATSGPTKLIRPRAEEIQQIITHYIRLHEEGAPRPWPRCDPDTRHAPPAMQRRASVAASLTG
jgi:DNA-binding IclR family transcriptional regulator